MIDFNKCFCEKQRPEHVILRKLMEEDGAPGKDQGHECADAALLGDRFDPAVHVGDVLGHCTHHALAAGADEVEEALAPL